MRTANNTNNYTVEGLVAKYRDFVKDSIADWQWDLAKRVKFCYDNDNDYIIIDGQVLLLHNQSLDQIFDYFNINFPGCEFDNDFTNGVTNFYLGSLNRLIDDYMTDLVARCRADYQLLAGLYRIVVKEGANIQIMKIMSIYADKFNQNALEEKELVFLCQHFSDVVSFEFENENKWFSTIEEERFYVSDISKLSTWIIDYLKKKVSSINSEQSVYAFNAGRGEIAQCFPQVTVKGCGSYGIDWALGQIYLYAITGKYSEIEPFEEFEPQKESLDLITFDAIDYINGFGDIDFDLNRLYDSLKVGGKMIIFATRYGTKSDADSQGNIDTKWFAFVKRLVEEKAIESIVTFEKSLHTLRTIIAGDQDDIILFVEKKVHSVVKVDNRRRKLSAIIDADSLDRGLLWPSYYLTERPERGCSLGSLIESVMDYKSRTLNAFFPEENNTNDRVLIVEPTLLGDCYKDSHLCNKSLQLQPMPKRRYKYYYVPSPSILTYIRNEKLLVGYIDGKIHSKCLASDTIGCFVPKQNIDPLYIVALFMEPTVKQQIVSVCDGVENALEFSSILDRIIVPQHSLVERLQLLSNANYQAFISSQHELKRNHEDYKKAVRMRKHAMTQSLSSIEDMFDVLDFFRVNNNGKLSDDDMLSFDPDITVKDAFAFLSENLKEMMPVIEHIADVEYSFESPKWIDPEEFIEEYIAKHQSGWRGFIPVITWQMGHNRNAADIIDPTSKKIISKKGSVICRLIFPEDALGLIFKNIISNARAHAFTDSTRDDYMLRFSWHTDGLNLKVVVENNGTPIPSDYDTVSLLEYGVSSKLHQNGHNGIGCNEIYDIMQRYGGKVDIISTPEDEFTVKYVLTFKSNVPLLHINQLIQIQHK